MEQRSIELASWSWHTVGDAQLMFVAHRSITITVVYALVDKNGTRLSSRVARNHATWCVDPSISATTEKCGDTLARRSDIA
jgi:hypothetical protein